MNRYVPVLAGSAVGTKASSTGILKARGNFQVGVRAQTSPFRVGVSMHVF